MQFIPARGRKLTITVDVKTLEAIIAIYPRAWTETLGGLVVTPPGRLQVLPARGRKHFFCLLLFCFGGDCNLSPRGDGNGPIGQQRLERVLIAIYPREGTETEGSPQRRSLRTYCNLSPRGDGNVSGRQEDTPEQHIAIYPREGTETVVPWSISFSLSDCNLSPRGDGNLSSHIVPHIGRPLQFIPARGRKLFRRLLFAHFTTIAIYPREGTETNI